MKPLKYYLCIFHLKEVGLPSSLKKHVTKYMKIKFGSLCLDDYNSLTTVIKQFSRTQDD